MKSLLASSFIPMNYEWANNKWANSKLMEEERVLSGPSDRFHHVLIAYRVAGGQSPEYQYQVTVAVECPCLHVKEPHKVLNREVPLPLQIQPLFRKAQHLKLPPIEAPVHFPLPVLPSCQILLHNCRYALSCRLPCGVERVVFLEGALKLRLYVLEGKLQLALPKEALNLLPLVIKPWGVVQPDLCVAELLVQLHLLPQRVNKPLALPIAWRLLLNLALYWNQLQTQGRGLRDYQLGFGVRVQV